VPTTSCDRWWTSVPAATSRTPQPTARSTPRRTSSRDRSVGPRLRGRPPRRAGAGRRRRLRATDASLLPVSDSMNSPAAPGGDNGAPTGPRTAIRTAMATVTATATRRTTPWAGHPPGAARGRRRRSRRARLRLGMSRTSTLQRLRELETAGFVARQAIRHGVGARATSTTSPRRPSEACRPTTTGWRPPSSNRSSRSAGTPSSRRSSRPAGGFCGTGSRPLWRAAGPEPPWPTRSASWRCSRTSPATCAGPDGPGQRGVPRAARSTTARSSAPPPGTRPRAGRSCSSSRGARRPRRAHVAHRLGRPQLRLPDRAHEA